MENDSRKKRPPRVKQISLDQATFRRDDSEIFQLYNISSTGIAFLRKSGDVWPEKNISFGGVLKINDHEFSLRLSVQRYAENFIGCKIENPDRGYQNYLELKFSMEISAVNMTNVAESALRPQPDGNPHWFFDGLSNELYFVEKNNVIQRFRINTAGHFISYTPGRKVYIEEENDLIALGTLPVLVDELTKFVLSIEGIDKNHRASILDILKKG